MRKTALILAAAMILPGCATVNGEPAEMTNAGKIVLAACRTLLEWPQIEQFLAISSGAMQNSAPSAGARGVDFA